MGALSLLGKQNLFMGLSLLHTLSTKEGGGNLVHLSRVCRQW